MARPTKDPSERRNRWDALYVTDVERAAVTTAASGLGLSVSRYLLSLHAQGTIVDRSDWRRNIQMLTMVSGQLDCIARSISACRSDDAGSEAEGSSRLTIAMHLLELERLIRGQIMPWRSSPPPEDHPTRKDPSC